MQLTDSLDAALEQAREVATTTTGTLLDSTFWFGLGMRALRVAFVVALALLVLAVVRRLARRWVRKVQDRPATDKRRQRVLTVADLMGSVARYVVWTVATIMVLAEVGLDVGPLLAGAGIAGLAIGFGAQTLVKDVISGLFLLFDDTIGVGDLIRFNQDEGEVEYVGLRLIKVRKFNGELLMIPAGELRVFGNRSIGYARAIVDVGLSYEQDVNEALRALEEVAREWAETEAAREAMIEEAPQVQAVTSLGDSAVTSRVVVKVRPGAQFQAERDLRRLIKKRFDEMGVEIPFPRRTVYVKSAGGGEASPDEAAAAGS
jgi:small conductance mechanosensitive channel